MVTKRANRFLYIYIYMYVFVYIHIYRSVSYSSDKFCRRQTSIVHGHFGGVQLTKGIVTVITC